MTDVFSIIRNLAKLSKKKNDIKSVLEIALELVFAQ